MSKSNFRSKFKVEHSPRDERFYTPRAQASSGRSQSDSIADYGTPRTSRDDNSSSRSAVGSLSDSEYVTPRLGPPDWVSTNATNVNVRGNNIAQQKYGVINPNQKVNMRSNYPPLSSRSCEQSSYDPPYRQCRPRPPLPQNREVFDGMGNSRKLPSNEDNNVLVHDVVEEIFSFARHSRFEAVNDLLSRGVPVNVHDQNGNTILSIACQNGNKRMAKLALRYGADINAINNRGNSALHFCYRYGFGPTLGAYLISKGADVTIRNHDGHTCIEEGR